MKLKELEAQVEELKARLRTQEDIEEIKKLQRIYAFYLERWMAQEMVDLFSNGPDVSITFPDGTLLGKEGIKREFFESFDPTQDILHQMMMVSEVIDVDPDGKTAKGRWYGFGFHAIPQKKGILAKQATGIYENEYIKEDGKWKFKKLNFRYLVNCPFGKCWVDPAVLTTVQDREKIAKRDLPSTDPPGYRLPFHFKHPITGK